MGLGSLRIHWSGNLREGIAGAGDTVQTSVQVPKEAHCIESIYRETPSSSYHIGPIDFIFREASALGHAYTESTTYLDYLIVRGELLLGTLSRRHEENVQRDLKWHATPDFRIICQVSWLNSKGRLPAGHGDLVY